MIHAIIADSRTVRVLEMSTIAAAVAEVAVFRNPMAARHDRDLLSDRAGRTVNPGSRARQAYEPKVGAKRMSMQRWLKDLGSPLRAFLQSRGSERVILVAAPRTLAQLQKSLPVALRRQVCEVLPLDLANQPLSALQERLEPALLAVARKRSAGVPAARQAVR